MNPIKSKACMLATLLTLAGQACDRKGNEAAVADSVESGVPTNLLDRAEDLQVKAITYDNLERDRTDAVEMLRNRRLIPARLEDPGWSIGTIVVAGKGLSYEIKAGTGHGDLTVEDLSITDDPSGGLSFQSKSGRYLHVHAIRRFDAHDLMPGGGRYTIVTDTKISYQKKASYGYVWLGCETGEPVNSEGESGLNGSRHEELGFQDGTVWRHNFQKVIENVSRDEFFTSYNSKPAVLVNGPRGIAGSHCAREIMTYRFLMSDYKVSLHEATLRFLAVAP